MRVRLQFSLGSAVCGLLVISGILYIGICGAAWSECIVLRPQCSAVHCVQFSKDCRELLALSEDGTGRIWSVLNWDEITQFNSVDSLQNGWFSSDGRSIITFGKGVL